MDEHCFRVKKRVPIAKKVHKKLQSAGSAPIALPESVSVEEQQFPVIHRQESSDLLVSRSSGDGQEDCPVLVVTEQQPLPKKCLNNDDRFRGGGSVSSSCCCEKAAKEVECEQKVYLLSPHVSESDSALSPLRKHSSRSTAAINSIKECDEDIENICKNSGHKEERGDFCSSSIVHAKSSMDITHKPGTVDHSESKIENFLVGPGGSALLGKEELLAVLPDQKVRVFLGSWNTASQAIDKDEYLREWLKEGVVLKAHIFALGIQEGPVLDCSFPEDLQERIQKCIGETFLFLVSVKLGVQVLMIFIHRSLVWFVSMPSCDSVRTNSANVLQYCAKTKGAVAVVFRLFRTSILFISCHLSYGTKSDGRVQDYRKIVQTLKFKNYPLKNGAEDVVCSYDNVFWLGDLNFKLEHERSVIESLLLRAPVMVDSILHKDQLKKEIKAGSIFHGFHEPEIKFHPTYKYDLGSNNLDSSSKNRVPAYTDRILHRRNAQKKEGKIESLRYYSSQLVCFSDHKPVYSIVRFPIKPGISRLPSVAPQHSPSTKSTFAV